MTLYPGRWMNPRPPLTPKPPTSPPRSTRAPASGFVLCCSCIDSQGRIAARDHLAALGATIPPKIKPDIPKRPTVRLSYLTLFIESRHVRADLRAMGTALRTQSIPNADEVIRALQRALDLIPLAPSPERLRRRLRRLARVLMAMEQSGGDLEPQGLQTERGILPGGRHVD